MRILPPGSKEAGVLGLVGSCQNLLPCWFLLGPARASVTICMGEGMYVTRSPCIDATVVALAVSIGMNLYVACLTIHCFQQMYICVLSALCQTLSSVPVGAVDKVRGLCDTEGPRGSPSTPGGWRLEDHPALGPLEPWPVGTVVRLPSLPLSAPPALGWPLGGSAGHSESQGLSPTRPDRGRALLGPFQRRSCWRPRRRGRRHLCEIHS